MSTNGIGALERGDRRTPQRETLALLAEALNLEPADRQRFEAAATRRVRSDSAETDGSTEAGHAPRHNLREPLTTFVGRESEVAELSALVRDQRLVTVTGSGGIGKTRIALHIGRFLHEEIPAGVWFVDLAPVADASLVAAAIAGELGLRESSSRPLLQTIVAYLREKALLLILDNCEHVVAEAAAVATALLQGCPAVRILATSREPLKTDGEHVYRLSPLRCPSADAAQRITVSDALGFGAISLFTDRARAVDRHFMLADVNAPAVLEICRRLDGIPLAIELAAARVSVLPVNALRAKLDQFFRVLTHGPRTTLPRHQTLRALIDWSYDLLSRRERTFFRRLCVFAGGWSLESCVAVCSDDEIDEWDVFDLLGSLVEKSLVIVDTTTEEPRYRMLESTRHYAREQLTSSGEVEALARKHALHQFQYIRDKRPAWEAMEDLDWQRAVSAELDNIRAALDWTLKFGNAPKLGMQILSEIMAPTLIFDPIEARNWYRLGYEHVNEVDDDRLAAAFRCRNATTTARLHEPVATQTAICEESAAAARVVGDPVLLADALKELGVAYWRQHRFDEADAAFAEAWSLLPVGNIALAARIVTDWAGNDFDRGDLDSAEKRFSEALRIARPHSHVHTVALMGLAEVAFLAGKHARARVLGRDAMAGYRVLGMATHCGVMHCNLASYAMEDGALEEARDSLAASLTILLPVGLEFWLTVVLEQYAVFAARTNNDDSALALLGYSQQQDVVRGRRRERRGHDRALSLLRQRLGPDAIELGLAYGASFTQSQALALAFNLQSTSNENRGG